MIFYQKVAYWASLNGTVTQHGFSSRDFIDSIGRRIYQTVNVNGMYNVSGYFDYNFKIKKTGFNGGAGLNLNYGQNVNFVNGEENKVTNGNLGCAGTYGLL